MFIEMSLGTCTCTCVCVRTLKQFGHLTHILILPPSPSPKAKPAADHRNITNSMTDFFDKYMHTHIQSLTHTERVEARKQTNKQIIQSLEANGKTL